MRPKDYLKADYHKVRHWMLEDRSKRILEFFDKYADRKDKILELGCSSGRNLVYLSDVGFKNVTGLEFSDDIDTSPKWKLIHKSWEEAELEEYDIIFSASFLQEYTDSFPQELFDKTLAKTRKYFMIFGDYLKPFTHNGFTEVERMPTQEPFSQPIIILKNNNYGV